MSCHCPGCLRHKLVHVSVPEERILNIYCLLKIFWGPVSWSTTTWRTNIEICPTKINIDYFKNVMTIFQKVFLLSPCLVGAQLISLFASPRPPGPGSIAWAGNRMGPSIGWWQHWGPASLSLSVTMFTVITLTSNYQGYWSAGLTQCPWHCWSQRERVLAGKSSAVDNIWFKLDSLYNTYSCRVDIILFEDRNFMKYYLISFVFLLNSDKLLFVRLKFEIY